jgi:hypothetical protein
MDTVPSELIARIVHFIPKSDLGTSRLVCRAFDAYAFFELFDSLPHWFDLEVCQGKLISKATDRQNRPAVIWSPWAVGTIPECNDIFLRIAFRRLCRRPMPDGLKPEDFGAECGFEDINAGILKTAQNRYVMHKSYTEWDDSGCICHRFGKYNL